MYECSIRAKGGTVMDQVCIKLVAMPFPASLLRIHRVAAAVQGLLQQTIHWIVYVRANLSPTALLCMKRTASSCSSPKVVTSPLPKRVRGTSIISLSFFFCLASAGSLSTCSNGYPGWETNDTSAAQSSLPWVAL